MAYTDQPMGLRANHRGIVAAIIVHAAAVGVFLLSPPIEVGALLPQVITARNIPLPKNPPPSAPVPAAEPQIFQPQPQLPIPRPRHDPIRPPVPDPISGDESEAIVPRQDTQLGSGDGTKSVDRPVDPVIPDPVLTQPELNQRFSRQFQPPYPADLLRREVTGDVTVRVLVGVDGRARVIQLVSAAEPELWERTRSHGLRNWRFAPATRDGKPVEGWITLTVKFTITA